MMGRALQGNVGALTRCGISFNEAQENILKYGNESERAAIMAEVITQNVGAMNAEMGKTSGGQAVQKMNAVNDVLIRVGKGIKGAFDQLKTASGDIQISAIETIGWAFTGIVNSLSWLARQATETYSAVKPVAQEIPQFFSDHWPIIEPILIGIAAAMTAYELSTMGGVIASVQATAASIAHGAASVAETSAIIALTIAQDGLNAAIAMCPVMWIVDAIIVLVVIFYLAIAAVNHFAGTSLSATGIIVGAFFWWGAMIYNVIAWEINNLIAFAEFLGNFCKSPLAATYNLFSVIWNGVVEIVGRAVNEIIGLINKIPGVNIGYANWGSLTAQRMDIADGVDLSDYRIDYSSGNFMKGYDIGSGLGDRIQNMFHPDISNIPQNELPPGPGLPESLGEDGQKTADNTGRMADKMDVLDEDLKYLRDVAEQEVINKYTTAEVKIDLGGVNNTINNDMDLDGVVRHLSDGLIGAMRAGAEAVHP